MNQYYLLKLANHRENEYKRLNTADMINKSSQSHLNHRIKKCECLGRY